MKNKDPDKLNYKKQEKKILKDLKSILNENSLILDIGANRGQFLADLKKVKVKSEVYCFEPQKEAFMELSEVAQGNQGIHVHNIAVSLKNGMTKFHITKSDVGSSILKPKDGQTSQWLTLDRIENVETIRLDTFIESENLQTRFDSIDLLKVDAQGYDIEVLHSAGKYLNSNFIKAILLELNFREFYHDQPNYRDILTELSNVGFRLAWLYQNIAYDGFLWWADALFLPEIKK